MKIDVLTLFPEMFAPVMGSMLGKAQDNGIIDINLINIRDFSNDKHNKADDYSFGGGPGMVMMADPIFGAMRSIGIEGPEEGTRVLYMSPRGHIIDRARIETLSKEQRIVILCGHYEGVDQRALDRFEMEEVSIGDYILTGGELPAMVLIDSVARLIPGVLAGEESAMEESIYSGLLEYPQYTKPRSYEGMDVPEVLVSGNHKLVDLWRFEQSLMLTKRVRPDLFDDFVNNHGELSKDERKVLEKILK